MTMIPVRNKVIVILVILLALIDLRYSRTAQATDISVANYDTLVAAINTVSNASPGENINIILTANISLANELPVLKVPAGVTLSIIGNTGNPQTINGNGNTRGLIIDSASTDTVTISNVNFTGCVATGGAGGNGAVGGGAGAGMGGAIYVKSGNVVLSDVNFNNNRAVGGNGGKVLQGSNTAGGGGGMGGAGGGGAVGDQNYAGGGGGGLGKNAAGGNASANNGSNQPQASIDGSNGLLNDPSIKGGQGRSPYTSSGNDLKGTAGVSGGGGAGSYGIQNRAAAGGGGGGNPDPSTLSKDAQMVSGIMVGGHGGYGGGG
ncbi:MAG: hypothetical protein FWC50_16385, partial [Planctomycetaceae bacterium]|nr:hypothetical protein [Planctomycetaceae bacterium]